MKLGYFDFNPDYSIRPDDLARACEERGYDSLWLGEHINIPVGRLPTRWAANSPNTIHTCAILLSP
jgi:alkanesulfonate monooxygenase SsuD/methylene tetrahydromethanopterin reductase-like flavin-dependent oxidoreductase (luciferase family)